MTDSVIGIGIIGCGTITKQRHAPEYSKRQDCKIMAVTDFNPDRAKELADMYNAKYASSYEEILNNPLICAVSICTANHSHAKISIEAMKTGKHVLCEKPMALSSGDARDMLQTAQETDKILMPAHNQRFFKSHQKVKEIIDGGALGRVLTFSTSFKHGGPEGWSADKGKSTWFMNKSGAGFGVVGDLGVHKIDLIQFLLSSRISNVYADLSTLYKTDEKCEKISVDDEALLVCTMENGARGTINVSWNNYGREENFTILYFEKGRMLINYYDDIDIVIERRGEDDERFMLGGKSSNDNQMHSGVIDAFLDSIKYNKKPAVTGMDGYLTIAVLDAAIKSSNLKRAVDVKL